MENKDNINNALIRTESMSLSKTGNTFSITNRLINSEISELFNQGFCKMNSKKIKSVDKDYLFELEHSLNNQILKNFNFEAEQYSDYEQAFNIFKSVLELKPNHSLTHTMIGICFYNISLLESSIDDESDEELGEDMKITVKFLSVSSDTFKKAIHFEPTNALAFYFHAKVIRELDNETLQAIESATRAIEIESDFSQAYLIRGAAMEESKDYSNAMYDYSRAIDLDSTYSAAYFRRGLLRKKQNELNEAMVDLKRAMDINPNFASRCSRELGNIKLLLGDSEGAKQDFENDPNGIRINQLLNRYKNLKSEGYLDTE